MPYTQYLDLQDDGFLAIQQPSRPRLPDGYYSYDRTSMGMRLLPESLPADSIYLDDDQKELIGRVRSFIDSRKRYSEMGFSHKRGYLFYGPPGSGKTTVLRSLISQVVTEYKGVVLKLGYLGEFADAIQAIKDLSDPSRPILVVCEDVEEKKDDVLTNVMDGMLKLDNVFFAMTTNNINQVSGRIKNRPSRVDEKLFVGYPSEGARRNYVSSVLKSVPNVKDSVDVLVDQTEGLSIAHIKELMIKRYVFNEDISQIMDMYKKQCAHNLKVYGPDALIEADIETSPAPTSEKRYQIAQPNSVVGKVSEQKAAFERKFRESTVLTQTE